MKSITRIDIGCGGVPTDGYEPWDIKQGRNAESLDGIADGQLDAIRASHVLEHLSHRKTMAVLREWARALRIGGELKIAVPDFDKIVAAYVNGSNDALECFLMGGQTDEHDAHYAIFNRNKLTDALGLAGFDVVSDWASDQKDCAALPVSLNLVAVKRGIPRLPIVPQPDIALVMSMPRLAWTDNMQCAIEACSRLKLTYIRHTGVFWGQCLQRTIEEVIADGRFKYIVTCDYDTVFTAHDIVLLRSILEHNDLDVLAPLQVGRDRDDILAMLDDGEGKPLKSLPESRLLDEHWPCLWAHFGLTMLKVDAIKRMSLPLFHGQPEPDGKWGNGRTDDDIYFWRKARKEGLKCSITPMTVVGHLQVLCSWPDRNLKPVHQYMPEYLKNGRPLW